MGRGEGGGGGGGGGWGGGGGGWGGGGICEFVTREKASTHNGHATIVSANCDWMTTTSTLLLQRFWNETGFYVSHFARELQPKTPLFLLLFDFSWINKTLLPDLPNDSTATINFGNQGETIKSSSIFYSPSNRSLPLTIIRWQLDSTGTQRNDYISWQSI